MESGAPALGRTSLVLYGSETGNAQDFAEEIGRLLERLRFITRVAAMDDVKVVSRQIRYCKWKHLEDLT